MNLNLSGLSRPYLERLANAEDPRTVLVAAAAETHGVRPELLDRVITQESGGSSSATSPKGAAGVGQLMPATARELGVTDVRDPVQNLFGSAKYLAQNIGQFGDEKLGLAAYNAGPGNVRKYGGVPPFAETQNYVSSITGDAPAPTAQAEQPSLPDVSGLSREQLEALAGGADPESVLKPHEAAPGKDPGVFNAETGTAVNDAQAATMRRLQSEGLVQMDPKTGQVSNFQLQTDSNITPEAGQAYLRTDGRVVGTGKTDDALGFAERLTHDVSRLNAINPVAQVEKLLPDWLGGAGIDKRAEASAQKFVDQRRLAGGRPGLAGSFAGDVLGTLPTAFLPGGVLAQGAAAGALASDATDAGGIARDALIGGAAGKATKVAGAVIAPRLSEGVQALRKAGVPLTIGQTLGGVAKSVEDKLTSLPFVGDAINSARRRGLEGFNRATINQTLEPLGVALPKNLSSGHAAVAHAEGVIGRAYDDILPRVAMRLDSELQADLTAAAQSARDLLPERAEQFQKVIGARLSRMVDGEGNITGRAWKRVDSQLGKKAADFSASLNGDERELGSAIRQVQGSLRDMVERQNPDQAPAIQAANQAWAKFTRVRDAAAAPGSNDGVFGTGALKQATRRGDRSMSKSATAKGEALMQEWAQAGFNVLPSKVPDSGTAGRLGLAALGGVGGQALHLPIEQQAIGAGLYGALGLPYLPGARGAVDAALFARPAGAQQLRERLARLRALPQISGAAAVGALQPRQ